MIISILTNGALFERRECTVILGPDGKSGAIWRGLVYPILPGDCIETTTGAFHVSDYPKRIEPPFGAFTIVDGLEAAYVLLSGSVTSCERIAEALKSNGCDVIRTGRYLGDSVEGLEPDWFVRFVRPTAGTNDLSALIESVVGITDRRDEQSSAQLRAKLLATELALTRDQKEAALAALAELKQHLESREALALELANVSARLEEEQRTRRESPSTVPISDRPNAQAVPAKRAMTREIEAVIEIFLPSLNLLRESLMVVATEFADRRSLYRSLTELSRSGGRLPSTWKKLKGLDQWWERHVSNGQDDAGRIYARIGDSQTWEVLISHKGEQGRDIAWLNRA